MRTTIIPIDLPSHPKNNSQLDLQAIAVYAALGFFLDDDTFYTDHNALNPGRIYPDTDPPKPWFEWHYEPRDISFEQAVDEFGELFEAITHENLSARKIILPLSGGLDSRTQAVALKGHKNVFTYSYHFQGGHDETRYGRQIAAAMGWEFEAFSIQRGYLWNRIEDLARINRCYSEFTHPRQMAIFDQFSSMGDIFYLGHWGDVLFDDMGVLDDLPEEQQIDIILKKIIKKGGAELGAALWEAWGLPGDFKTYLYERVSTLLKAIHINNANARIRAFKSLYWAPRWTSVNLSIFSAKHPLVLPYYDERMCKFICTIPEKHLAGRQIQIEYIKRKAPELARIPWQPVDPCNLYNPEKFRSLRCLPLRAWRKAVKIARSRLLNKPFIQRNWELQFVGKENETNLEVWLFENEAFKTFMPQDLVASTYDNFRQKDPVYYSHAVSMLLTLSVFTKLQKQK